MALLAPPPHTPPISVGDNDDLKRLRLRMTQIAATTVTLLVSGWVCTFGPIPAILALMTAKHILVAILMMGLGVDARQS